MAITEPFQHSVFIDIIQLLTRKIFLLETGLINQLL